MPTQPPPFDGATAVITHHVLSDRHADYEAWMAKIVPLCKAAPGHLDWHIVRPVAGITDTYTIVIRFDTTDHLREWMDSAARKALIAEAQPLLAKGDRFHISSGLDFWFTPEGAKAKLPVRWKQWLITWSAIFPLSYLVQHALLPLYALVNFPDSVPLHALVNTGCTVLLMVYVVMPRYTRLVRNWLFK